MSDPLRERIAAMRAAALDHLEHDPAVSGGIGPSEAWTCLGIIADCTRVLAALHPPMVNGGPVASVGARPDQGRAMVSDDNMTIRLTVYTTPDGPPVGIELSAPQALWLGHDLSAAGLRHLGHGP